MENPRLEEIPDVKTVIVFDEEWCQRFFELSGDANTELHSMQGHRIVQGAAIITKVGTLVSEHMPNYMVADIGELAFKRKVTMNARLTACIRVVECRPSRTRVALTLADGDAEIVSTTITLVSARILRRNR